MSSIYISLFLSISIYIYLDLSISIYLYMFYLGGMEIKLDVEKFSNLVNLDVKLIVKDCVKESIDLDDL